MVVRKFSSPDEEAAYKEKLRKHSERMQRVGNLLIEVATLGLEKLKVAVEAIDPEELSRNRLPGGVRALAGALNTGSDVCERALGVEDVARGLDELAEETE